MADIDIERRRSATWPWIVAALVILLVAMGIVFLLRERRDASVTPGPPGTHAPVQQQPPR